MNLMRIIKLFESLLAIILCVVCIPVNAQKEDYNEQCKINLKIEEKIKTLVGDTTALHQAIAKFDSEQMSLNAQIDSIAILCKKLKGDIDDKAIANIQQKVDSLSGILKNLQERKNELVSVNRQKESALSELMRNISSMGAFSKIKYEQMYTQYQEILVCPYSVINIEKLHEIESNLKLFTEMPDFEEFNARLKSCKKNKELYEAAEALLNSKFDADIIEKTRDRLYELLSIKENDLNKGIIKLSETQYSEIDSLDIKLSRYGNGIAVLQEIVKTINDSNLRDQYQGNKAACIDAMRSIVISKTTDEVEKRQRYFDVIPSLKNLYCKYWEELQVNPFAYPTASETIIMQLNNE